MTVQEEVRSLLARLSVPHDEQASARATPEALRELQSRLNFPIPQALSDWLQILNGTRIGPGGVLGVRPDDPYCDVESLLKQYPEWLSRGWIPVAGDGCGNYYVVLCLESSHPIGFIDTSSNYESIAYLVASDLWLFLKFLFEQELESSEWPFGRDFVLKIDPALGLCSQAPLPWDA